MSDQTTRSATFSCYNVDTGHIIFFLGRLIVCLCFFSFAVCYYRPVVFVTNLFVTAHHYIKCDTIEDLHNAGEEIHKVLFL